MNGDGLGAKAERLRGLHRGEGMLVLPNAWDCISARVFEDCGFRAVATTSAGVAWALGYPDGERVGMEEMMETVARIAGVVSVPVTADVEAGFGDTSRALAATARAVIRAGAVGLNLEDVVDARPPGAPGADDVSPLRDPEEQAERISAVVEAGREAGVAVVVNARTDVYWREVGPAEGRFGEVILRSRAFLEAGADCVFVPGVKDSATIAGLVEEIPGPLNVLAGPGSPSIDELAALGVRRVSVGSGPARASMGSVRRIGNELLRDGVYSEMERVALPYPEANALFEP